MSLKQYRYRLGDKRPRNSRKGSIWIPKTLVWSFFIFFFLLFLWWECRLFPRTYKNSSADTGQNTNVRSLSSQSSTDQVVGYLLNLARMPTKELKEALYDRDEFFISEMTKKASCPAFIKSSKAWPKWLPPKRQSNASKLFKNQITQGLDSKDNVTAVLWYDHVSKAGGTSFCDLANKNLPRRRIPLYHCMPSDGGKKDGRVGLWSNDKLVNYIESTSHLLVTNEWHPFDESKFDLETLQLVFVTTIRNPLDRLLSSYRFWAVRPNPENPISFDKWLERKHYHSRSANVPDWGIAQHVGNYNFVTWKFSNGTMPLLTRSFPREQENRPPAESLLQHNNETPWRRPFETAIRTLSQFDLVLPMEDLNQYPQPLVDTLGWTKQVGSIHVVSQGTIANSNAEEFFDKNHYEILWEANRFDMILYYWVKATYLIRIHCADVLEGI